MKEELNNAPAGSIRTFSGIYINVFDPKPDMIRIEDIAHALSMNCRWGGHLKTFYSVAQHSVMCAELATANNKLAALLHDASEAYLLDIPRPIKHQLDNYREIEHRLMMVIAEKFQFEYPMNKEVKEIDDYMLRLEWKHLVLRTLRMDSIKSMQPGEAKGVFLKAYRKVERVIYY